MKSLIFIITLTFFLNDNLIGIWKSIEENEIKYLNFKDDGKLIEVGQVNITKYNFSQKNNFIWLGLFKKKLVYKQWFSTN